MLINEQTGRMKIGEAINLSTTPLEQSQIEVQKRMLWGKGMMGEKKRNDPQLTYDCGVNL